MKGAINLIQKRIQAASRAHTQTDFFDEILLMVFNFFDPNKDNAKLIPDAIDVTLDILKVNPSHWCTFSNTLAFHKESIELQFKDVLFDLNTSRLLALFQIQTN